MCRRASSQRRWSVPVNRRIFGATTAVAAARHDRLGQVVLIAFEPREYQARRRSRATGGVQQPSYRLRFRPNAVMPAQALESQASARPSSRQPWPECFRKLDLYETVPEIVSDFR